MIHKMFSLKSPKSDVTEQRRDDQSIAKDGLHFLTNICGTRYAFHYLYNFLFLLLQILFYRELIFFIFHLPIFCRIAHMLCYLQSLWERDPSARVLIYSNVSHYSRERRENSGIHEGWENRTMNLMLSQMYIQKQIYDVMQEAGIATGVIANRYWVLSDLVACLFFSLLSCLLFFFIIFYQYDCM